MNRQARRARAKQITAAGVSIAVCTRGEVASTFVHSLVQFIAWDAAHNGRFLGHGAWALSRVGTGNLPQGRNEHVERFLAGPVEWLMLIDDDMGWPADAIEQLVESASLERPVMGGLCFTHRGSVPGNGIGWMPEVYPTVYDWHDDGQRAGFVPRLNVPRDTVIPVAATGAAFLLIHRTVLERIRDKHGPDWFTPLSPPGEKQFLSEDFSFCIRCASVDVPIHVNTGVVTSHRKEAFLDDQYLAATAFGDQQIPVPTAILIPTYGRAERLERVVADVHAGTPEPHRVYLVAEPDDQATIDAAESLDCELIVNERARSYAGAINTGVARTTEPLIFCAADDLHFHPGWLATAAAQMTGQVRVVGTNDLFNPAVLAGQHATHYLVDRRYTEDPGGVADQDPGVLLFEGYDHNYCDTEFIATATARGVFRPCLDSIVEHLHPLAGKAANDPTYERGFAEYDQDAKRYRERESLWAA